MTNSRPDLWDLRSGCAQRAKNVLLLLLEVFLVLFLGLDEGVLETIGFWWNILVVTIEVGKVGTYGQDLPNE